MKHLSFKAMGTTIRIQIQHAFAELILEEAKEFVLDFERRFSANDQNSLLMKVNQAAGRQPVRVDADIYELIRIGKAYSIDPNNTLNIAIGPLIKLWRIGFDGARVPSQAEIDQRLALINPELITLDDETHSVYLAKKGMEIDLGALAKGYCADLLKRFFRERGVEKGLIDLGGNILLIGDHPINEDKHWRIGVQNPFQSRHNTLGVLKVRDNSIVTSGIYERTLTVNREEYHHIFDSKTGYPVKNDIASVTIVSEDSLSGEIYTTLFYEYESEETIQRVQEVDGIEAIVVTREGEILLTDGIRDSFMTSF